MRRFSCCYAARAILFCDKDPFCAEEAKGSDKDEGLWVSLPRHVVDHNMLRKKLRIVEIRDRTIKPEFKVPPGFSRQSLRDSLPPHLLAYQGPIMKELKQVDDGKFFSLEQRELRIKQLKKTLLKIILKFSKFFKGIID